MKRYNLVLRRMDGSGSGWSFKQDTPIIIVNYLKKVREKAKEFTEDEIFNFDESSFYMETVGNYTVSNKGARKTYAATTG